MRWKDGFTLVPGTFKDTESESASSSVVSDSVTPWTSLPGSSVHGILQARILELVAISFSRGSSKSRDWTRVSCVAGGFFFLSSEPPGKRLPKLEQGSNPFCQSPFSQVGAESVILNKAFLWDWYLVGHTFFFFFLVKWNECICFSSSACSFRETFWVWYAFINAFSEVSSSDLHHISKAITVNFNRNKLIRMPVKNTTVDFSCYVFVCQYQILNSRDIYLLTEIRVVEICHHNCIWTKQNAVFWNLNRVERWIKSLIYLSEVILKRFFAKAWRKNI